MTKIFIRLVPLILLFTFIFTPLKGNALELLESYFLKITVIEKGIEHQWEYTSPESYEYEIGDQVIKTEEAKEKMKELITTLRLSEEATVEEMVQILKNDQFPAIERLDIRWMNGEHKLFTWVWDKKQE